MALAATAASITRLLSLHQTAPADPAPPNGAPNQTIIYLSLGALIGVAYSLGTEKFIRAMQHRHIFIRNAMLWLSAIFWLFAAAAVAIIASLIYNQSGGGLEGFDRVLGVLIPFVVRADLIVDWAKRVAWALLNMSNWTQSSVQLCRMLARAHPMTPAVQVDPDLVALAMLSHSRPRDFVASEDRVWAEDADSLVRLADVLQHFEKLGRVAVYAVGGLVGAVPAAVAWVLYAGYYAVVSFLQTQRVLGVLYCLSVLLAPLGAVIVVLSSAVLLCGVVALSVVGTLIQFAVYWSTRTVYSMVRIALSQAWAGFPDITRTHESSSDGDAESSDSCAGQGIISSNRRAEEAGAAIAHMGIYLPTELEFALASWDGFDHGETVQADWFSTRLFNMNYFKDSESVLARDMAARSKRNANCAKVRGLSKDSECKSRVEKSLNRYHCDSNDIEVAYDSAETYEPLETHDSSTPESEPSAGHKNVVENDRDTVVMLLRRLGLDLSVKSARKRRLSTYYAFGMLVQLQLDSGGNAWRLNDIEDISDEEFRERIDSFDSIIADEAGTALTELSSRLKGTSRYRIIPSGTSHQQLVPVTTWLRLALLAFLETPDEREESMHLQKGDTRRSLESPYTGLDLHQWNRIGILDEDDIAFDVPTRITG